MVDVGDKPQTVRKAIASGRIKMNRMAFDLIACPERSKKGDVLGVARLAGIMAAKKTSELIPLCHNIALSNVSVNFASDSTTSSISVSAQVRTEGNTGCEMEALTAVSAACLTIWDMVKAVSGKEMSIHDIKVTSKEGGQSGSWSLDQS